MLEDFLLTNIYYFLICFARIGTAFAFLPGFAETYVPSNVRIALALGVTLTTAPLVQPILPPQPGNVADLTLLIAQEILIGGYLGMAARLLLSALDVAANVIAQQTGLASAMSFNPAMGTQGTVVSAFLGMLAIILVFVTDLHHLILLAVTRSYEVLPATGPPPIGDFADMIARMLGASFEFGLRLAAPFLVLGTLFNLGMGILARLMPQLQIFIVALPLQIIVGLVLIGLILQGILFNWLAYFQQGLLRYVGAI